MRMKISSLVAIALVLAMVFAGCAGQGSSVSTTSAGGGAAAGDESDSVEADEVVTLDLFANFVWLGTDSWSGIIPEAITEATGIALEITRATDSSQLGVMIASGELPDLVWTDSELDRLADPNLSYSYNELIEQYSIDWQPSQERISIAQIKNADPEDENYYTMLSYYSTVAEWEAVEGTVAPSVAGLYYRQDIWEELGSPAMDTMDDIVNVLEMVQEAYPDMIPLSGGNSTWRFSPFAAYFGLNSQFIYDENGDAVYRDSTQAFYDYAKYVNNLYQKGLFPEENLAMTNESDAAQQFTIGNCFMYEHVARAANVNQLQKELQSNVAEGTVALLSIPDDSANIPKANAGWSGVFISKNCKNPEAAIKLLSYLNSDEGRRLIVWGREGIEYTLDENDMPIFSEEWIEAQADADLLNTKYNTNFFMTNTEIDEQKSYFSGFDQEIIDTLLKNSDKFVYTPELAMIIPLSSTDVGISYTKIKEARKSEVLKLYTAPDDNAFETAYEGYIDILENMGLDEVNAYAREQVKTVLASME